MKRLLPIVLKSKPRRRTLKYCALWLSAGLAWVARVIATLPAKPFLWASEAHYRAVRGMRAIESEVIYENLYTEHNAERDFEAEEEAAAEAIFGRSNEDDDNA